METTWAMVYIAWGVLFVLLLVLVVFQWRKTPNQKKEEQIEAKRRCEEDKQKENCADHAPAKGAIERTIEFLVASLLLLIAVIFLIVILSQ